MTIAQKRGKSDIMNGELVVFDNSPPGTVHHCAICNGPDGIYPIVTGPYDGGYKCHHCAMQPCLAHDHIGPAAKVRFVHRQFKLSDFAIKEDKC
jgi:recombinational DNA repair protein (RecF pathway)